MAKIIFQAGTAVTARWLNASQFLGPGNPGVVFKANPTNDWEYPLLTTNSINVSNFSNSFLSKNSNATVGGIKTFSASPLIPTPSSLADVLSAVNIDYVNTYVSGSLAAANFVDIGSVQTITGIKTFNDLRVDITPDFADSPISRQYAVDNLVAVTGNQNISGTKSFADCRVTPPTEADDATPKSWVENLVTSFVTSLNASIAAVSAIVTTHTGQITTLIADLNNLITGLNGGTNPATNSAWITFPNGLKFLWISAAGTTAQTETITFPGGGSGFPGFSSAPVVLANARDSGTQKFGVAISALTTTSFVKSFENFGGGGGSPISYLAIGI